MNIKTIVKGIYDALQQLKASIVKRKYHILGNGSLLVRGRISIVNEGSIELTGKVRINSGFQNNRINGYSNGVITVKPNGKLILGDDVGLSNPIIYCTHKISIGEHTLVGADTKIVDTDFHPVSAEDRLEKQNSSIKKAPIEIGKNVFIGMNCLIMKGVKIGDNAVIAAGSVISKDVPAGEVVASAVMHSLNSNK